MGGTINGPSLLPVYTGPAVDVLSNSSYFKFNLDYMTVPVCGSEACQPIPVPLRPTVEFLWQIDPFQLVGGGDGTVGCSGIDYILPYWMGRYYGAIAGAVESAGATRAAPLVYVSPGQINFVIPDGTAPGLATLAVTDGATTQTFTAAVRSVAPTLFLTVDGQAANTVTINVQ